MEDFEFASPTRFIFGREAELKTGIEMKRHKATKVLLHYGSGSVKKSGLLDRVKQSLEAEGIVYHELGGVRPNPEITLVREGVELCKEKGIDWICAIGGGSVIDSAKAIAAGAYYEGDVWEFFETGEQTDKVLPLAVVLTIPAAGSEASKNTVISNDALKMKSGYANDALRPLLAFMNPELTFTLPAYQTGAGLTDMYCHLLERFFDDMGAVSVTDNLCISLMKTVRTEGARVLADPENYDARANIMWAGMLCHQGLAGLGRHEDWTSHALEHELSALDTSVTHGAGLAVVFPAWMRYVYRDNLARFVYYGREVFGISPTGDSLADARLAIEETSRMFSSFGMPTRLSELGIAENQIEDMIPTLEKNRGKSFGSFKEITLDGARTIYQSVL